MSGPARVQLVELDSGRAVPLTEDGVSAGGPSADIVLRGAETLLAFVDPTDEGFVITDAGLAAVTVNDAPVIGQRLARVGDRVAFGEATYRIESVPEVVSEMVPEVAAELPIEAEPEVRLQVVPEVEPEVAPESMLKAEPIGQVEHAAAEDAPLRASDRHSALRSVLGWLLVIAVVVGSGAAGYVVAAMLRGGR